MKNYIILSITLFFYTLSNAQIVSIPDAAFKNELVNRNCVDIDGDGVFESDVDTNDDGEVQETEAEAVLRLNVGGGGIVDLTGIQSFTNLLILSCNVNELSSIDITQNTQLERLSCGYNPITSIDISQNIHLIELNVYNTSITEIDLSNNPNIEDILVRWNNLSSLDISNMPNLRQLACNGNQITGLDVSNNSNLEYIICDDNQITSLDVSQNPNLYRISAQNNQLTYLNVQNGNNENFIKMFAFDNPNLSCIQVDNLAYANSQPCNDISNPGWCKDDTAIYSEGCALGIDNITISSISLYPNPVKNTLYLQSQHPIKSIKMYDVLGNLVLEKQGNVSQIDISHLTASVLFVQLETEQGVLVKKVVKQ